ncbi:MAG: hypothetical protein CM15mP115_22400 [Alphaproteobacteria bacterium]|nr:MAG: hypothetical protein CM15mP115_22400 [Alphaproteobacteria bacterium]
MSDIWIILTPLLRFAFYPALLLAIGGVIFLVSWRGILAWLSKHIRAG